MWLPGASEQSLVGARAWTGSGKPVQGVAVQVVDGRVAGLARRLRERTFSSGSFLGGVGTGRRDASERSRRRAQAAAECGGPAPERRSPASRALTRPRLPIRH